MLGRDEWLAGPRFKDKTQRTRHHAAREPLMNEVTRTRTTADWVAAPEAIDAPCGPLNTIAQAAADPQTLARETFAIVEHPGVGSVWTVGTPMKFSRTPAGVRAPSLELGQHTAEVLARLATCRQKNWRSCVAGAWSDSDGRERKCLGGLAISPPSSFRG